MNSATPIARTKRLLVAVGLGLVIVIGGAAPARAYVRARTPKTFMPLFLADPRKGLELARPPEGIGISDEDLRTAAEGAVTSWSYPQIPCTGIDLWLGALSKESQAARRDGRNRIIMRVGAWFRDPVALTDPHDPAAVAVTVLYSRNRPGMPEDGQILEGDIEVNAVDQFQWGLIPDGPISGRDFANIYDLTSVITHEMGHFIGLDHNCLVPGAPLLVDDEDTAIPSCSALPAAKRLSIENATMYPFVNPTEIRQRTLTADDTRAACEIYPVGSPPLYQWTGGGGCSYVPTSRGVPLPMSPRAKQQPPPPAGVAAFLVAAALLSRRARGPRRARGAPDPAPPPQRP